MSIATPCPRIRKSLGAYYTPNKLSDLLCRWVIQSESDLVLEPSFGGCSFLAASFQRLAELGAQDPDKNVYGYDVDGGAFSHLAALEQKHHDAHFLRRDFLSSDPSDFAYRKFNAVVGNPPFVAPAAMSKKQRDTASNTMSSWGLCGKHSLWSLFIVHSFHYLADGGRMAWVVPSSIEFTRYGGQLLDLMAKRFTSIQVVSVATRQFQNQGTSQKIALLLADNFSDNANGKIRTEQLDSFDQIENLSGMRTRVRRNVHNRYSFESIAKTMRTSPFSTYGSISAGIVTGNSSFFTMSIEKADELELPNSCLRPIVQRGSTIPGIRWTDQDQTNYRRSGRRALMLSTSAAKKINGKLSEYLASMPNEGRLTPYILLRNTWHEVCVGDRCDAFVVFMNKHGPRLVINDSSAVCSNSMHRVTYKKSTKKHMRAFLAVLMMSSWGRTWAELYGRNYSHSTIKLEPGDLMRFPIPELDGSGVPASIAALSAIDGKLRAGRREAAEALADGYILDALFSDREQTWKKIVYSARRLRKYRMGN